MGAEEIAKYLGVSKDKIYGWIAERETAEHKVERLWNSWVRG